MELMDSTAEKVGHDYLHDPFMKSATAMAKYAVHAGVHQLPAKHLQTEMTASAPIVAIYFLMHYQNELNNKNQHAARDAFVKAGVDFGLERLYMVAPPLWATVKACEILQHPAEHVVDSLNQASSYIGEVSKEIQTKVNIPKGFNAKVGLAMLESDREEAQSQYLQATAIPQLIRTVGSLSLKFKAFLSNTIIKGFGKDAQSSTEPSEAEPPPLTSTDSGSPEVPASKQAVQFKPVFKTGPDSIGVGIESPNLVPGMNTRFTVEASGINNIVSDRLNRAVGCRLDSGEFSYLGHAFKYEIKSSGKGLGQRLSGKRVKLKIKHKASGNKAETHIHLENAKLSAKKNQPKLDKAFAKVVAELMANLTNSAQGKPKS